MKELEAQLVELKAQKPVEDVTVSMGACLALRLHSLLVQMEEYFQDKKELRAKFRGETDSHHYL